jgi:hypothetical protein
MGECFTKSASFAGLFKDIFNYFPLHKEHGANGRFEWKQALFFCLGTRSPGHTVAWVLGRLGTRPLGTQAQGTLSPHCQNHNQYENASLPNNLLVKLAIFNQN